MPGGGAAKRGGPVCLGTPRGRSVAQARSQAWHGSPKPASNAAVGGGPVGRRVAPSRQSGRRQLAAGLAQRTGPAAPTVRPRPPAAAGIVAVQRNFVSGSDASLGCCWCGLSARAVTDTRPRGSSESTDPCAAARLAAMARVGLLAGATGRPVVALSAPFLGMLPGAQSPAAPLVASQHRTRRRSIPERKKSACRKRISLTVSSEAARAPGALPARPPTPRALRRHRPQAAVVTWRHASVDE